jgi:hypothetical protein
MARPGRGRGRAVGLRARPAQPPVLYPQTDAALLLTSRHREALAGACGGDLVGYGPMPNECVRRVTALPGVCVAGNHDLIALGA